MSVAFATERLLPAVRANTSLRKLVISDVAAKWSRKLVNAWGKLGETLAEDERKLEAGDIDDDEDPYLEVERQARLDAAMEAMRHVDEPRARGCARGGGGGCCSGRRVSSARTACREQWHAVARAVSHSLRRAPPPRCPRAELRTAAKRALAPSRLPPTSLRWPQRDRRARACLVQRAARREPPRRAAPRRPRPRRRDGARQDGGRAGAGG